MTARSRRVRRPMSLNNRTGSSSNIDPEMDEDLEGLPDTPAGEQDDEHLVQKHSKLTNVEENHPAYYKEYRLGIVHQCLLRKVPLSAIAEQFGVSVSTIQSDRREIFRRMREESANMDINEIIGETKAFYDEIMGQALSIASMKKTPIASKLASMRTAMQGRKELAQWFSASGVFDVLKFRAAEDTGNKELNKLVEIAGKILTDVEFSIEDEDDEDVLADMLDEQEVRLL